MKKLTLAVLGAFASYAGAALAMHIGPTPIERFQRPVWLSAPLVRTGSHAAQYAGRTTLGSGQATVVISTRAVGSDSLLFHSLQMGATLQSSGFGAPVCVRSITPGAAMILGWADGNSRAFDTTIMWELRRAT